MVFKNLCIIALCTKVASALGGLIVRPLFPDCNLYNYGEVGSLLHLGNSQLTQTAHMASDAIVGCDCVRTKALIGS